MNHISLVGVEIEGGWDKEFPDSPFVFDRSVQEIEGTEHVGELNSPPLLLPDVLKWTEDHYPIKVNDTCGLHIHTSFKKNNDYSDMMDREWWNHFQVEVEKFGRDNFKEDSPFWPRFEGKNRFCKRIFDPLSQSQAKSKVDTRRTHLNYAWKIHQTLECRLFPCFPEVKDALKSISFYCDLVEGYLKGKEKNHITKKLVVRSKRLPISKKKEVVKVPYQPVFLF